MTRRIRKVTLYVCTMDGSVHTTRSAAKVHADKLDAAHAPRPGRKAGPTWVTRVLGAIDAGAKDARAIRERTDVPARLVHPTLSNLRKRGLVKGGAGTLALTREGKKHLA